MDDAKPKQAAIAVGQMHRYLKRYFLFFGALALIAFIPGAALWVLIITGMMLPLLGVPGLLVLAAPTILLYSIALVPLLGVLAASPRRLAYIAPAIVLPLAVAFGPGLLSQRYFADFAGRMAANDMIKPAMTKPRSIELLGDRDSGLFPHTFGDARASCDEICRRLLFNGEVDWVRMTRIQNIDQNRRPGYVGSVTYHRDHRETCPEVYPDGSGIENAVRNRLVAGDCLIEEDGGDTLPEVIVRLTTRVPEQKRPSAPADNEPLLGIVKTVRELQIEAREGGQVSLVQRLTETTAELLARPFYIGAEIHMQGGYNGPVLGRQRTVTKPIDVSQELRNTLGYSIAEIAAPLPELPRNIVERLLALPESKISRFSTQQQDVLKDVLKEIEKKPTPSEADVAFIGSAIADDRVTSPQVGIAIQHMVLGNPALFEPLIPTILDRIAARVDQGPAPYKDLLGWSLQNFSIPSLRPYREKMIRVAENQTDWPSNGVLVRLAELDSDDAVNLVIRRLDSTDYRRQFAAIAACRATPNAWGPLEPAILAHLTPRTRVTLDDDESPLLLALVRFGKKAQAFEIVKKRRLQNEAYVIGRLDKLGSDFDPSHCRDRL